MSKARERLDRVPLAAWIVGAYLFGWLAILGLYTSFVVAGLLFALLFPLYYQVYFKRFFSEEWRNG